ncbi:hypothetical protein INT45_011839 [Circinella minor]|uniref:Uncharacterized protein n=1 Tax=Circinella minor TaxID=1195481 RepID=A0A8H7RX09_9FUNG|nr:hypothetical protein INT45_011839 [Circinella minor]
MSWAQSSSSVTVRQQQQQQQDHSIDEPNVRASLDCGLTIPVRQTSKHYELDPKLQAKVDRVVSSNEIRLISQRIQRGQRVQSMCSCPASDVAIATNTSSITLPVQDKEESSHHYNKKLSHHFHPDSYYQHYHSNLNNSFLHQQSPPPPPPPHHHFP